MKEKIVYEGKRNYKCEFCDKFLFTTSGLKNHVKSIHKGLKDHSYDICNKSFSTTGSLKNHMYTQSAWTKLIALKGNYFSNIHCNILNLPDEVHKQTKLNHSNIMGNFHLNF